jgi:hypothetical protein
MVRKPRDLKGKKEVMRGALVSKNNRQISRPVPLRTYSTQLRKCYSLVIKY